MKYILSLVMALSLASVGFASNCYVGASRQLVTEHYAAPVRERIVVEYAEVPLVKETVRDYYGNEVQRVVDRGRNKELVRVERQVVNHHNNVQRVVVEKQIVKRDRQNVRDRIRDRRANQKVKEVRIVEKQQVRGGY